MPMVRVVRGAGRRGGAGSLSAVPHTEGLVELGQDMTYTAVRDAAQFQPFAEAGTMQVLYFARLHDKCGAVWRSGR